MRCYLQADGPVQIYPAAFDKVKEVVDRQQPEIADGADDDQGASVKADQVCYRNCINFCRGNLDDLPNSFRLHRHPICQLGDVIKHFY